MEVRFERKWKTPRKFLKILELALKKSSFEFKKHYEPRWVNSIYYDDMFNNSVYQNLDGNQKKQKIRIRWYGKKNLILKPFIEIKKKTGFVVSKEKKEIYFTGSFLDKKSLQKLSSIIKKYYPLLINYNPVCSTHYLRSYYLSKDKNIRATIDCNIDYFLIKNFQTDFVKKMDKNIVLELKYKKLFDNYVRKTFTNINNLRLSRNSKFINSFLNI